jgi:uncharacterized protein
MLPERIGSGQLAEMAAQGASGAARLRGSTMPRLADQLAREGGGDELLLEADFRHGPEGLPEIRLRMTGNLGLICQRCLQRVDWPLAIDVSLTVIATERDAAELADPFDSVMLEEGELRLLTAAEDEILAALPLAPVHADASQCCNVSATAPAPASGQPLNRPFAGLGAMLADRRRNES